MACQSGVRDIAHRVGSYKNTPQLMVFAFVGAHPCGRWHAKAVCVTSPTGWAPTKIPRS